MRAPPHALYVVQLLETAHRARQHLSPTSARMLEDSVLELQVRAGLREPAGGI